MTAKTKPVLTGKLTETVGALDISQQILRILRCTANAFASSLGGFRFKAGTRPWLDGLSQVPAISGPGQSTKPKLPLDKVKSQFFKSPVAGAFFRPCFDVNGSPEPARIDMTRRN